MNSQEQIKYQNAVKSVEKIRSFYSHLIVYLVINTVIIVIKTQKIDQGETIWHAFYVPFFWGIGLLIHALKAFNKLPFLGTNWEEKKIKQFMEEEQSQNKK
jgi:hypothetical protein